MKITDVRVLGRSLPGLVLVEVHTDAGVVGIGGAEGHGPALRALIESSPRCLRAMLIGQSVDNPAATWRWLGERWGGQGGPEVNAMAAVDLALWDAVGKRADKPVHALLGGAVRRRVPTYASASAFLAAARGWQRKNTSQLLDDCRRYLDAGFGAVKFGWGDHFDAVGRGQLQAIRDVLGAGASLMLDFGAPAHLAPGHSVQRAIAHAGICADLGVFFLEEPLPPHDLAGYTRLAQAVELPIATGEMLCHAHEFERFIDARALDVAQPDAYRIGLTQTVHVARRADAAGMLTVPHSPWSALAIAAHAQVLATLTHEGLVEYPAPGLHMEDPVGPLTVLNVRELVENPPVVCDGFLEVTEEPGLGLGGFVPETIERLEALAGAVAS